MRASLMVAAWIAAALGAVTVVRAGGERTVAVAAAADLKYAMEPLVKAFTAERRDVAVKVTFGSSGNFFAQLCNRAPFDLYLSADEQYPRQLVARGLASKKTEFRYALGRLVVWVPNSSKLDVEKRGIEVVRDPSVRKVAIANPRHAPYGRAAEAALKKRGLHEAVRERLVLGENVSQTFQFVDSGAADVGIFAQSLVASPQTRARGRFSIVPADAHQPLIQAGVILEWARDRDAASAFCRFLVSDQGRKILRDNGFVQPDP